MDLYGIEKFMVVNALQVNYFDLNVDHLFSLFYFQTINVLTSPLERILCCKQIPFIHKVQISKDKTKTYIHLTKFVILLKDFVREIKLKAYMLGVVLVGLLSSVNFPNLNN